MNLCGRWLAGPVTVLRLVDLERSPTPRPQPPPSAEPEDSLRCVTCLLGSRRSKGRGRAAEHVRPGSSSIAACVLNCLPALPAHSLLTSADPTPSLPPSSPHLLPGFRGQVPLSLADAPCSHLAGPCPRPNPVSCPVCIFPGAGPWPEKCALSAPPSSSATQVCPLCSRRALLLVPRWGASWRCLGALLTGPFWPLGLS